MLTVLVCPHLKLLGQLRNHQEGFPALTLLRFQNVPEYVVSNVEDLFSLNVQQVTDDI